VARGEDEAGLLERGGVAGAFLGQHGVAARVDELNACAEAHEVWRQFQPDAPALRLEQRIQRHGGQVEHGRAEADVDAFAADFFVGQRHAVNRVGQLAVAEELHPVVERQQFFELGALVDVALEIHARHAGVGRARGEDFLFHATVEEDGGAAALAGGEQPVALREVMREQQGADENEQQAGGPFHKPNPFPNRRAENSGRVNNPAVTSASHGSNRA
jgi:hypothetical protein